MNDPEFRELVRKSLFAVLIALLFAIPVFFFFKNKLSTTDNDVLKSIKNNKTGLIYVVTENCNKCNNIKKELDKKHVKYKVLNIDRDKDYNEIIKRLDLKKSNIETPMLIYIKNGELKSYAVDMNKEDLNNYLENYKLME